MRLSEWRILAIVPRLALRCSVVIVLCRNDYVECVFWEYSALLNSNYVELGIQLYVTLRTTFKSKMK